MECPNFIENYLLQIWKFEIFKFEKRFFIDCYFSTDAEIPTLSKSEFSNTLYPIVKFFTLPLKIIFSILFVPEKSKKTY